MADQPGPNETPSKKPHLVGVLIALAVGGTVIATFVAAYQVGRSGSIIPIKPGDTAPIPMRSSLYDAIDPPQDNEWCVFVEGAQVTAVEVSEQNVLATYRATGTDERECPNDTKFVISKFEFTDLARQYERRKASEADRQELLRRAQESR